MYKRAFTVVEVLVAAAIFSVFSLGVFSLFNMGSRMYLAGSWKFSKQKEGERFLQILKERIEQASVPAKIIKNGERFTIEKAKDIGYFINKDDTINVKGLNKKRYISEFIVSKVDKSKTASETPGLILYHTLFCESQNNGLSKLCLYANTSGTDSNFLAINSEGCSFPPNYSGEFNAEPKLYNLPNSPHRYELSDVKSIIVNNGYYDGSGTVRLKSPVIGLIIQMECPKHPDTTLDLKMQARIDPSLKFVEVNF